MNLTWAPSCRWACCTPSQADWLKLLSSTLPTSVTSPTLSGRPGPAEPAAGLAEGELAGAVAGDAAGLAAAAAWLAAGDAAGEGAPPAGAGAGDPPDGPVWAV